MTGRKNVKPAIPEENVAAPTIFGDEVPRIDFVNGNIKIIFVEAREDFSGERPGKKVVSGRVIIPIQAAAELANSLHKMIATIEKELGRIPDKRMYTVH